MMKYVPTVIGVVLCFSVRSHAAALERSGQLILPFFEPGHYAELSVGKIHPNISAESANQTQLSQTLGVTDFSTGNLTPNDDLFQAAVKVQLHPQFSAGLILDQPFGVKVNYTYAPESILGREKLEAVKIHFKSQNLTAIAGFQPNVNWNIYAGLAHQRFQGELDLFGKNYYFFNGYNIQLKPDNATGWLAGISYQIPEIALRTSLTYRSRIKHKVQTVEYIPLSGPSENSTEIETPQSINLDFMSGISTTNLIYGAVRWVNWKNFEIQPEGFKSIIAPYIQYIPTLADFKLINYQADQWSAKIGIAHKINERWYTNIETGWDSGSNNPLSTINPVDGYNSLGTGFRYTISPKSFVSAGLYYLKFRPATAKSNSVAISTLSTLDDKNVWAYGLKFGHFF